MNAAIIRIMLSVVKKLVPLFSELFVSFISSVLLFPISSGFVCAFELLFSSVVVLIEFSLFLLAVAVESLFDEDEDLLLDVELELEDDLLDTVDFLVDDLLVDLLVEDLLLDEEVETCAEELLPELLEETLELDFTSSGYSVP